MNRIGYINCVNSVIAYTVTELCAVIAYTVTELCVTEL
jgi:hypothetical protein